MTHRFFIFVGTLASLLLLSCVGSDPAETVLDEIAVQMNSAPDSALARLDSMEVEKLCRHQRMRWELLRGVGMNKTYVDFTTDSVMLQVVDYFNRHGDANEQMLSYYILGCAYRDMGDAPRAVESYKEAIQHADTLAQHCDWATLLRVHSQLSDLYNLMRLTDDEQRENIIAEQISWQIGDTLNALYFSKMECNILFNNRKYYACISKAEDLIRRYQELGLNDDAYLSSIHCIRAYLSLGDYARMKEAIDEYEKCSYFKSDTSTRYVAGGACPLYIYKSEYYLGINKLDSAEMMLQKALTFPEKRNNRLLIYLNMTDLYERTGQTDSLVKYTKLYAREKEISYDETKEQNSILINRLYDYNGQQMIAHQEKLKSERLKIYLFIAGLTIFILILVGLSLRYIRKLKTEQLKSSYHSALQELRFMEEQLKALITEKKLSDISNAQKASDLENLIAQKENVIKEMKAQITMMEKEIPDSNISRNQMILEETIIVKRFKYIWTHIGNIKATEDEWKNLRMTVEEIYPNFYRKLNDNMPLSEKEYRTCLLIKCGFSPSAISNLLGMSPSYSTQMRKHLMKKVFNIDGSASHFDKIIYEIQ